MQDGQVTIPVWRFSQAPVRTAAIPHICICVLFRRRSCPPPGYIKFLVPRFPSLGFLISCDPASQFLAYSSEGNADPTSHKAEHRGHHAPHWSWYTTCHVRAGARADDSPSARSTQERGSRSRGRSSMPSRPLSGAATDTSTQRRRMVGAATVRRLFLNTITLARQREGGRRGHQGLRRTTLRDIPDY